MEFSTPTHPYDDVVEFLRQSSFDDIALIEDFSLSSRKSEEDFSYLQHHESELVHINPQKFDLPKPITRRKASATEFSKQLSADTILQILANANSANDAQPVRRPYSSAGAIYPIEVFVGISSFTSNQTITPGVYHQLPYSGQLEFITRFRTEEIAAAMTLRDTPFTLEHLTILFYAVNIEKCIRKYGHRGLLFAAMDVGAICRNIEVELEKVNGASRVWGGYRVMQLGSALSLDPAHLQILATQLIGTE